MKQLWQRLSKRERAWVFAALMVVAALLAYDFAIDPMIQRREMVQQQLALQPDLLEKNIGFLAREESINKRLNEAKNELRRLDRLLFEGDTPSVIASALQEVVRAIAAKDDIRIVTTRVLQSEQVGPFLKIPVQVDVVGQIEQVAHLITGIASNPKYLIVDEANIRSVRTRASRRRRKRSVAAPAEGELRASLIIAGFSRGPMAEDEAL